MKFKEWFCKQKVLIGGIAIGVFCTAAVGMLYTTYQEGNHQEKRVIEVAVPTSDEKEIGTLNAETIATKKKGIISKNTDTTSKQIIDEESLQAFQNIDIEIEGEMSIEIFQGNAYALYAQWEDEGYSLDYEIKNNTLTIRNKGKITHSLKNKWSKDNCLKVWIPEDINMNNITVESNTDYIKIAPITIKNLTLEGITGDVELEGTIADQLKLENNTGRSSLVEVNAKEVKVASNTGTLEIKKAQIEKLIADDIQTGAVNLLDSKINQGAIEVQTGGVNLSGIESQKMNIDMQTGSVAARETQCDDLQIKVQAGSVLLGKGLKGEITVDSELGAVKVQEKDNSECIYHISNELGELLSEGFEKDWQNVAWEAMDW